MKTTTFWTSRTADLLWTTVDICLLALLAYWLVQIGYTWVLETSSIRKESLVVGSVSNQTGPNDVMRRNPMMSRDRNPFLPPHRNEPSIQQNAVNRSGLKLWGTITGDDGLARAVIESESDKRQHLLKIGEWIGEAKIVDIRKDRVILLYGSQRQELPLQQWQSIGGAPTVASSPSETGGSSPNRISVKRTQIDEAIQNINTLMKQVRIVPNFTDGKPDGLALSGVMTGSFFSSLGLQSGDILLGVDGKPIQSADDALKIYTGLKTANRLQLNLRRNGREEVLEYAIE